MRSFFKKYLTRIALASGSFLFALLAYLNWWLIGLGIAFAAVAGALWLHKANANSSEKEQHPELPAVASWFTEQRQPELSRRKLMQKTSAIFLALVTTGGSALWIFLRHLRIEGRIRDLAGKACYNVNVVASEKPDGGDPASGPAVGIGTRTDESGHYGYDLAKGEYLVTAFRRVKGKIEAMQVERHYKEASLNEHILDFPSKSGQSPEDWLVHFDSGHTDLDGDAIEIIKSMGSNSLVKTGSIVIAGHTDEKGSSADNHKLGIARAQRVAATLIKDHRIEPSRIICVSFGKRYPAIEDSSLEAHKANRRVEIYLIPAGGRPA